MADITLVNDLIQLVRDDIDESNLVDISDAFILKKLNRAQRNAVNKIIKGYDELFLTETGSSARADTTTVEDQINYDLPTDIYGTRLENVSLVNSDGTIDDLVRIRKQLSYKYTKESPSSRPTKYCIVHREVHIYPAPKASLTLRLTYTRLPETLVKQQGVVRSSGTDAGTGQDYITVDDVGSSLTATSTSNNCFVNFINPNTGEVRGTCQIASVDDTNNIIYFKASGLTKSSVLGKTVSVSLPSDIAVDDYICTVHGTCIPEIPNAYIDYLVQHAVVSIKRAKGEPTQEDYSELKDQEAELKNMWAGLDGRRKIVQKFRSRYARRSMI